jgi:hypothetical protein
MKVICRTPEEFMVNLEGVEPSQLLSGVVRVSVSLNPLNEVKHRVYLTLTAIVMQTDCQYLLEMQQVVGFDYLDGDGDAEGTATATKYIEKLQAMGYKTKPGVFEI